MPVNAFEYVRGRNPPPNIFGDLTNDIRGLLGLPSFEETYNISSPVQDPGAGQSGPSSPFDIFSPETAELGDRILTAGREGFDRQQTAIKDAGTTIRGAGTKIEDLFGDFMKRLGGLLPDNPFSDELLQKRVGGLTAGINRGSNLASQNFQNIASRRGLSSGGSQSTQAATDIRLKNISDKQSGTTALEGEQLRFNQAANQFKGGLEAGLTIEQASNLARLGLAESGTQLTGALAQDPLFEANLFADLFGVDKGQELDTMVQEALESNDPSDLERIFELLSNLAFSGGDIGGGLFADFLGGS